jgi:bifunctional non-homologous end joining protein LigD
MATTETGQIQALLRSVTTGKTGPVDVSVDGQTLRITSPDKVLWPAHGDVPAVTKGGLIAYLAAMAPLALPHLRGRPLTAIRFQAGITGPRIYQKNWEKLPEFVPRLVAPADKPGGVLDSIAVDNLATLLWLAQMNVLELHPWLSRAEPVAVSDDRFNYPDMLVFDLDPFVPVDDAPLTAKPPLNRAGFAKATRVALALRDLLVENGLEPHVKTSGKTGIHVYAPIERRYPFELTRALAEAVGNHLMAEHPDDVTLAHAIPDRRGKILVDYGQNGKGKNQVAPYSPRATEQATVSMPVTWDDLPHIYPTDFTIPGLSSRAPDISDPWGDFFSRPGRLEQALKTFGLGTQTSP